MYLLISSIGMYIKVISSTPLPQTTVWVALSQDYSADPVTATQALWPNEETCGNIAVRRLLNGDRGHYGCLEHPSITLNCVGFPHSVVVQARTHRMLSFDVQSMRYTSQHLLDVADGKKSVEEVFYFRPVGEYRDRAGKRYTQTKLTLRAQKVWCKLSCLLYRTLVQRFGFSEEHARDVIPYNVRQHFVVSMNLRSALHFMDLRAKPDAQLEIQQFCDCLWPIIEQWSPEIAQWYTQKRLRKAKLSP